MVENSVTVVTNEICNAILELHTLKTSSRKMNQACNIGTFYESNNPTLNNFLEDFHRAMREV